MASVPYPVRLSWYACRFAVQMAETQMRVLHAVTLAMLGKTSRPEVAAAPEAAPAPATRLEAPVTRATPKAAATEPAPTPEVASETPRPSPAAAATAEPAPVPVASLASVSVARPRKRPREPSAPPPLPNGHAPKI